jgi:hypothetical protein
VPLDLPLVQTAQRILNSHCGSSDKDKQIISG